MNELERKLLLRPTHHLLVLQGPPEFLAVRSRDELTIESEPGQGAFDNAVLFAEDRAAAESNLSKLLASVRPRGVVWLAYRKVPKGDMTRRAVWEVVEPHGWLPVTQIAIDETWTAMRLRPRAEVGT